jgi:hypothetical protein
MAKTYLYALASVPRLGPIERAKLKSLGIVPAFSENKDVGDPPQVSLRFDAPTEAAANARLRRALGSEARLASQVCRMAQPEMDGLTSD